MEPKEEEEKSGETGLKNRHSVADEVSKMLDDFQHRPRLDDLRLIERYIKREFHLLVDFTVNETNEKYVAFFERAEVVGRAESQGDCGELRSRKHFFVGAGDAPCYQGAYIDRLIAGTSSNNGAMLVDVVKAVQDPEIVPLPSVVWFERAERIDSILPHALYFSANMAFVFRGFRSDEKAGFVPIPGRTASSNEVKLLGEMIEGASEILHSISKDHGDNDGNRTNFGYIMDWLSCLRIALGPDYIWACSVKGPDCAIQISDVLVGPFNFQPN